MAATWSEYVLRLEKINQRLVKEHNIMAAALRQIRHDVISYQQYPPCREACYAAETALVAVGERLDSDLFIQEADYRPRRVQFQP